MTPCSHRAPPRTERVLSLISELPRSRLDDFYSHAQRRGRRFPVPPRPRERLLWQELAALGWAAAERLPCGKIAHYLLTPPGACAMVVLINRISQPHCRSRVDCRRCPVPC